MLISSLFITKKISQIQIFLIYNSSIAIFSDKITKTQTSITLNTDDYEVYVTVIGIISIGEHKEERVVYDFVEPVELPKKYDIKTEKEYVNDKLSSLYMKNTYRLKKRTTNSSLFEIEISDGISVKQTTYSIDMAVELYYDTPTYANDTHLKIISDTVSKGKRIALVQCDDVKEEEIMISFFVKENKETNENITLDYIFKYRSVKEVSEIKTYEFVHSFTSSIFFSTLTVSFTEIFAKNQTDILESSNYYIFIYNSNNVSAISTLESIDIDNLKQNAMTTDTFKGNNNGTKYELEYKLNSKVIIYVVILSRFVTKDNDNHIELYGVQIPNSKNYIFTYIFTAVIVVGLVLVIVVTLLVIRCNKKKKKNENVTPINETIGNVQLLPTSDNN